MSAPPKRVLAHGYLKNISLRSSEPTGKGNCPTGAVCHHSSRQFILAQPGQCVEGPADLERADALVILTFEEELDPRMRWSLPLEGGTDKSFLCLGGGCKVREGRGC